MPHAADKHVLPKAKLYPRAPRPPLACGKPSTCTA